MDQHYDTNSFLEELFDEVSDLADRSKAVSSGNRVTTLEAAVQYI